MSRPANTREIVELKIDNCEDRDSRFRWNVGKTKDTCVGRLSQSKRVSKTFMLKSPDGKVYIDHNLKDFAFKHRMYYGGLMDLCKGIISSYKGWTGKYLEY